MFQFKSKYLPCFLLSALFSSISTASSQVSVFDSATYPKNRWSLRNAHLDEAPYSKEMKKSYPLENSSLHVAVMNYPDLKTILRYKKLELGIEIPTELNTRINHFLHEKGMHKQELNPFLEWEIDVEATFYHEETGVSHKINGFYTRDYVANSQTDDWDELATNFAFRVRFAPPLNGEWKSVVSIRINQEEKPTYFSNEFWFHAIESGDPGYVKVFENGRNLQHGDQLIFPVGTNFPADFPCVAWGGICYDSIPGDPVRRLSGKDTIYYGHNLYSNSNTEKASNVYAWNEYLKTLSNYFQAGGKYIRTIQMPWSSLIEFEEKGNYYKRLHYAWEQDKILDSLEKYDALMIFNLLLQSPHFQYDHYGTTDWDWDYDIRNENGDLVTDAWVYEKPRYAYNDRPQGKKKAHESFINKSDLEYHKQRTRYYLARYGYSTKIMEFEILSEPFHLGGQSEVKNAQGKVVIPQLKPYEKELIAKVAIYNYHQVISEYLKDSLQIKQLVGINMGYDVSIDLQSVQLPKIDVAGANFYYASPAALYKIGKEQIVDALWKSRGSKLPILFTEGGLSEDYKTCSDYTQHAVDMMTFPFAGVTGYLSWYGWRETEEKHLWPATINTQEKMNGQEMIGALSQDNGNWTHGKSEAEETKGNKQAVEHQHYISENKRNAVGYVRNRTYNMVNQTADTKKCTSFDEEIYNSLSVFSWDDVRPKKRLRIEGLKKKTSYQVDWYSVYGDEVGKVLKSDCMTTTKKKGTWGFSLEFPQLGGELTGNTNFPVVWYVIRMDCGKETGTLP